MTTIWKYPLAKQFEFSLDVPMGAELLSVQLQFEEPVAWFRCRDDEKSKQRHRFRWVETGSEAPEDRRWRYVTTLQLSGGRYVTHLFVWEWAYPLDE